MFDALDVPGFENKSEFVLKQLLFLASQHVEDIFSQHRAAGNTKLAQLAVTVPGDNLVVAIDSLKREREAIDNCLDEAPLGLHFSGPSLHFDCQICRGIAGVLIKT